MRIKIIAFTVALCAVSYSSLHAQETGKKHEIGILVSGLDFNGSNSFNVLYRKQKSENVYRRIRATFGNLGLETENENTIFNFSAGLSIGREKRKTLDRKLEFYRGPEFGLGLGILAGDVEDNRVNASLRFGYVFGLQHSFSEFWAINLETIPSLSVNLNVGDFSENDRFGVRAAGSSAVSLGIVRKF